MTQALTSKERRELKQQAHHLNPVVLIGQKGLTEAVIRQTDCELTAHELIKIRIMGDEREQRIEWAKILCTRLNAKLITHIGKIAILWRKNPEDNQKDNSK